MAGDVWFHVRYDPLSSVWKLYAWPSNQPWPPPVLALSCFGKYSTLPYVICSRNLVLMWIALHYWYIKPLCVLAWGQRAPSASGWEAKGQNKTTAKHWFLTRWHDNRVGYWCISKLANILSSNINLAYAFVNSSQYYAPFKANILILFLPGELFVIFLLSLSACLFKTPSKKSRLFWYVGWFTLYWSVNHLTGVL